MEQASGIWEIVAKLIITIGAVGGAIYALITYNTKIKKWRKHRSDRRVALDKIIELAMSGGSCMTCNVDDLWKTIEKQTENIEQLTKNVEELIKQNDQQNAALARSLKQRSVHDTAILGIVEAIRSGKANGKMDDIYDMLIGYLSEEAHRPAFKETGRYL